VIREYEFYYLPSEVREKVVFIIVNLRQKLKPKQYYKFEAIVTSPEMILTDYSVFRNINWQYVIVDEAHRLKNKSSKLTECLSQFNYDHILLLSGTPIQNNVEELWTLLNIVDPHEFSSLNEFLKKFGNLKDAEQLKGLQEVLKPYLVNFFLCS
jgi:chromodomain-helicase-DNA-binding protein 7